MLLCNSCAEAIGYSSDARYSAHCQEVAIVGVASSCRGGLLAHLCGRCCFLSLCALCVTMPWCGKNMLVVLASHDCPQYTHAHSTTDTTIEDATGN